MRKLIRKARYYLSETWPRVRKRTRIIRNFDNFKKLMNWTQEPTLDDDELYKIESDFDLNDRRINDALVIGGACCNGDPKILLEIGTAHGHTTALMAENAPNAKVYTVNISPEEINAGGKFTTFAPSREEIGYFYRDRGLKDIVQLFENTKNWKPDFGPINVAFIDGSHDSEFVYNDTIKVLNCCQPGSLIIWHDYCPPIAKYHSHLADVCTGIDWLLKRRYLRGSIYHLQDSFTGLYIVP